MSENYPIPDNKTGIAYHKDPTIFPANFERVVPLRVDQLKFVSQTYKAVLSVIYSANFDGGGCRVKPDNLAAFLDISVSQLDRIRADALESGHLIKKGVGRATRWYLAREFSKSNSVNPASTTVKRTSFQPPSMLVKATPLAPFSNAYHRLTSTHAGPIDKDKDINTYTHNNNTPKTTNASYINNYPVCAVGKLTNPSTKRTHYRTSRRMTEQQVEERRRVLAQQIEQLIKEENGN